MMCTTCRHSDRPQYYQRCRDCIRDGVPGQMFPGWERDFTMAAAIRPGCGYWSIDRYPVGGCFRRVAADSPGMVLHEISGPVESIKGPVYLATTPDGGRVAVSADVLL